MKLKSILTVGALGLSTLALAACGDTSSTSADAAATAEPSPYEIALNNAIEACHVGVAASDGWRELDGGGMYELAKDVVRDNNAAAAEAAAAEVTDATTDATTATVDDSRPLNSRYVISRCARNMSLYANGGEVPAGITPSSDD